MVAVEVGRWRTEGRKVEEKTTVQVARGSHSGRSRTLEPPTHCGPVTLSLTFLVYQMETITPAQGSLWRSKDWWLQTLSRRPHTEQVQIIVVAAIVIFCICLSAER